MARLDANSNRQLGTRDGYLDSAGNGWNAILIPWQSCHDYARIDAWEYDPLGFWSSPRTTYRALNSTNTYFCPY